MKRQKKRIYFLSHAQVFSGTIKEILKEGGTCQKTERTKKSIRNRLSYHLENSPLAWVRDAMLGAMLLVHVITGLQQVQLVGTVALQMPLALTEVILKQPAIQGHPLEQDVIQVVF